MIKHNYSSLRIAQKKYPWRLQGYLYSGGDTDQTDFF